MCSHPWACLFTFTPPSPRSVQFSHSVASDSLQPPWTAAHQASLSITNSRSLLRLMSIVSVMPSNHLIVCHALLLPPSIFPSIRVFSNESVLCISWPNYWSSSFNISTSFLQDWLIWSPCSPGDSRVLLQHHSKSCTCSPPKCWLLLRSICQSPPPLSECGAACPRSPYNTLSTAPACTFVLSCRSEVSLDQDLPSPALAQYLVYKPLL